METKGVLKWILAGWGALSLGYGALKFPWNASGREAEAEENE